MSDGFRLYPFLHLQLGSVGVALLSLQRRQRESEDEPTDAFIQIPGLSVPVWLSRVVASGLPAPNRCRVTELSASRSRLRSVHRAETDRSSREDEVRFNINTE